VIMVKPKLDVFETESLEPVEEEEEEKKKKKPTAVSEEELERTIEEIEKEIPGSEPEPIPEEEISRELPKPLEEEEVISSITPTEISEPPTIEDKFGEFEEPPTTVSTPPSEEEEITPPPELPPPEPQEPFEEIPREVEEIVEKSYEEVIEEKTRPEYTLETMPKVLPSGEVYFKPEEYYYWHLLTEQQFKERGIPYTEEEVKTLARKRYETYMEFRELEESLGSYRLEDLEETLKTRKEELELFKTEFLEEIEKTESRLEEIKKELDLTPEEIAFLRELKAKYGLLGRIHAMTPEERAKLEKIVKETLEKKGVEVTPATLQANLLTVLGAYTKLLESEAILKRRYELGLKEFEELERQIKAYEEQIRRLEEWERGLGDITKLRQEVEKFLFSPPTVILTREELYQRSMEKLLGIEKEIEKKVHPQELPGVMASLHSELEYALEKYFPTPDIPESTLVGKGMSWIKNLPPVIREGAQFGVGIFAPLEEFRELGNYLGVPQPNVPTMLGGMVSGMITGSTEEIRMVEKYPAYAIGTLVGEVVWDYLLGKAVARGVQKIFDWIEAKVPKTPEGKWITVHYPPVTRRVLRGLEKLKNLLIEQKQIAKTIEEIRDLGLYRFDLEEGIEGISKSLIKIGRKELDEISDLRLLRKGDIVGGELREVRKFIPKVGEPSSGLRYIPSYERIDLGDIAEFTRRLEKLGAKEGIMFRITEEEGVRVPQLLDIRIGKKGLEVTRYTPTISFETLPTRFIEEGVEEFLGRFKPEYIKIKPEDLEDVLRKPPKGADWDEWLKYYRKKLEIGKKKYAVKPPEELGLRPPKVEEDIFKKFKFKGRRPSVEGLTAVSVSEDMKQLLKTVQKTEGIEELVIKTPSILSITTKRVTRVPTLPLTLPIPRVRGLEGRKLLDVEVEEPKIKITEKPVLDLELEELERVLLPVKIRYKPTLSIKEMRKTVGGFTRIPSFIAPSPKLFTFTPSGLKMGTSELVSPKTLERELSQILSPPVISTVETKTTPPVIPPILFPPGGAYPRRFGITKWRKWVSKWFNIEPILLPKPRRTRKRTRKGSKKKRTSKKKKKGRKK